MSQNGARILVVTAVAAEAEAIKRGLDGAKRFDVLVGGVGQAMAAARTAAALHAADYGLVVSTGIGGGFPGAADIGSVVIASEMIAADLGAETADGFLSVDELGFGASRIAADGQAADRLARALRAAGQRVAVGPIVTVSTVTGTAASAAAIAERIPGAAAEAMEGYGAAVAARERGLPVVEVRAISNAVGPRNRGAWRIPEALETLARASSQFPEVF